MLRRARERLDEFGAPQVDGLAGTGVDQVERGAIEDRDRGLERGQRLLAIVQAAEHAQVGIVQRLHAERNPVDAGRAIAAEATRLDAGRIGFQRDLGVGFNRPVIADRPEDRFDGRGLHQRGRAAAEEDGGDRASPGQRGAMRDFGAKRLDIAILVHGRAPDVAVEVAIWAFGQAERPMHVDAEARVDSRRMNAGHAALLHGWGRRGMFQNETRHAFANSRNARALWLSARDPSWGIPCFSSAVISPNVLICPSGRKQGS